MTLHQQTPDDSWVDGRLAALTPADDWNPNAAGTLARLHARRVTLRARRLQWTSAALVAAIVFAAVPVTRAFGARCLGACVNATARVAQWWRADEPGAAAPRVVGAGVGDLAPDLVGLDAQGTPIHLAAHRGRVVVLNFWATWCGPCRAEIPMLNDLQARYGAQGVDVIGISIDEDGWSVIAPFAAELTIRYPLALATDEVAAAYGGLTEVPATFVIDREGRIVIKRLGLLSEEAAPLQIERLIGR